MTYIYFKCIYFLKRLLNFFERLLHFLREKWARAAAGSSCSSGQYGLIQIELVEERSNGASQAGEVSQPVRACKICD